MDGEESVVQNESSGKVILNELRLENNERPKVVPEETPPPLNDSSRRLSQNSIISETSSGSEDVKDESVEGSVDSKVNSMQDCYS